MISRLLVLAAACASTAGCTAPTPPHGAGVAREALSRAGYGWRTEAAEGVHLHYLRGGHAAAHAGEFARDAAEALRHDLALAHLPRPAGPVEVFLVGSREEARRLTGAGYMGQAIPGELTVFIVALPGRPPAFRHEIMHALTLTAWGAHRAGSWLSDGVATWAGGSCQGHGVDAVAAGFLRDGTLPRLTGLADRFWEIDELHAYFTAASAVGFYARARGARSVGPLWEAVVARGAHPLGAGGEEMEAAWRRHLAAVAPARIDPERLRLHGCESP